MLDIAVMAAASNEEIGKRLYENGHLEQFEQAIANDDPMGVAAILQDAGVANETISRMLLELDKDYLLALVDAGRVVAG
jgi:hypothetical protein